MALCIISMALWITPAIIYIFMKFTVGKAMLNEFPPTWMIFPYIDKFLIAIFIISAICIFILRRKRGEITNKMEDKKKILLIVIILVIIVFFSFLEISTNLSKEKMCRETCEDNGLRLGAIYTLKHCDKFLCDEIIDDCACVDNKGYEIVYEIKWKTKK